jgi:hypothetical protein
MSIVGVTRELLVRYLDTWTPGALHAGKRVTFSMASTSGAPAAAAEAALRVFAEFTDRLRGRRLAMVVVAPDTARLTGRLDAAQAELGTPPELSVHMVSGDGDTLLPAALSAVSAAGAPLFGYVETTGAGPLAAVAAGRPAEVLVVSPAGDWPERRAALREAGFTLTAGVELVDGDDVRLLTFGTPAAKSLEAYKTALWAVDEYAGVRYRDPGDPDGHLLDISLSPHPGPLRRELLAHLAAHGPATVTDLRHFTLTETVYRAQDAARVLPVLLSAGAVTRSPERGRLGGDVVITLA